MAMQQNETYYQEEDTIGLFDDKKSNEYDSTIVDVIEKNNALSKEVNNIKREHEI